MSQLAGLEMDVDTINALESRTGRHAASISICYGDSISALEMLQKIANAGSHVFC